MKTITGIIESSEGVPLHRQIVFTSQSTPQAGASGLITGNTTALIMSDATTGEFSIALRPGNYTVIYKTTPKETTFRIAVVGESGSVSIDEIIVTEFETLPSVAPYTVWNGERAGHITFQPVPDADAPALSEVAYGGGHIENDEYRYAISLVTEVGETALSEIASITGSGGVDKANRVTMEVAPAGVTAKRIWRNRESGTAGSSTMWLLTEVIPSATLYDDWESHDDFHVRADQPPVPPNFNTTAGIIYAAPESAILYFSTSGLKLLADVTTEFRISIFGGNMFRYADGNEGSGKVLADGGDGIAAWTAIGLLLDGSIPHGDYGGGEPPFIPSSGAGLAIDDSEGRLCVYFSDAWH